MPVFYAGMDKSADKAAVKMFLKSDTYILAGVLRFTINVQLQFAVLLFVIDTSRISFNRGLTAETNNAEMDTR